MTDPERHASPLYHEPVERKVDEFLSTVESLLIAVAQRGMTPEQMDRLAAILQRAERDLLARFTTSPATVRTPRPAAVSRSSSGKGSRAA